MMYIICLKNYRNIIMRLDWLQQTNEDSKEIININKASSHKSRLIID